GVFGAAIPAGAQGHPFNESEIMKVNAVYVDPNDAATPQVAAMQELLRQRAVELDLLTDDDDEQTVSAGIEQLLAQEVDVPEPEQEECRRWYEANRSKYLTGELVHARHILFQVTDGTPVPAVRSVAEAMLNELRADPELFAERARANSNCPSGKQGGQ